MSKRAEKAALKLFPVQMGLVPLPDGDTIEEDVDRWKRKLAKIVYEQAEKDLALTWEDIRTICLLTIGAEVVHDNPDLADNVQEKLEQVFYEDVLRRFRETKNK